jgi:hypothetical protein
MDSRLLSTIRSTKILLEVADTYHRIKRQSHQFQKMVLRYEINLFIIGDGTTSKSREERYSLNAWKI